MNTEPRSPHDGGAADDAQTHPHRWLSALADGDREAADKACALWRDDPKARRDWHLYHLIGDVMRSDELAHPPARDEAFLGRLREQLAKEPVPLAPAPLPPVPAPAMRARLGWRAPVAVAAGFVVVAGVLVLTRVPSSDTGAAQPQLAAAPGGARPVAGTLAVGAPPANAPPVYVLDGTLIRDANLEAYLRAHQDARRGAREVLPGGGWRHAELLVPQAGGATQAAVPTAPGASR